MAELKCLIPSEEGCVMQDETAIVLVVGAIVTIAVALPFLGALAALAPKIPPPPPG